MLTLAASPLADWQSCRRRWTLATDWLPLRWRPKSLWDHGLRRAVVALSQGAPVDETVADAKSAFLQTAASPGLDLPAGTNPYIVARDWCAMYETTLRVLADGPLLALHRPADVTLGDGIEWRSTAAADDTGTLHRWVTMDAVSEDDLTREIHSWRTVGDMAVAGVPLVLHVIEIGQSRGGRRASPWARAFRHPTMPMLKLRFKVKAKGTNELRDWTSIYLADLPATAIEGWLAQMRADGVDRSLVHTYNVRQLSSAAAEAVVRDILREGREMADVARRLARAPTPTAYTLFPMARNACDNPVAPCPFQPVCYSEEALDPGALGLYARRAVVHTVATGGDA